MQSFLNTCCRWQTSDGGVAGGVVLIEAWASCRTGITTALITLNRINEAFELR